MSLTSNFFELLSKLDMSLYQYRVDFSEEIEFNRIKCGLLGTHEHLLGKYIFDGTLLHCVTQLPQVYSTIHR